jgi:hypothetical protein
MTATDDGLCSRESSDIRRARRSSFITAWRVYPRLAAIAAVLSPASRRAWNVNARASARATRPAHTRGQSRPQLWTWGRIARLGFVHTRPQAKRTVQTRREGMPYGRSAYTSRGPNRRPTIGIGLRPPAAHDSVSLAAVIPVPLSPSLRGPGVSV